MLDYLFYQTRSDFNSSMFIRVTFTYQSNILTPYLYFNSSPTVGYFVVLCSFITSVVLQRSVCEQLIAGLLNKIPKKKKANNIKHTHIHSSLCLPCIIYNPMCFINSCGGTHVLFGPSEAP